MNIKDLPQGSYTPVSSTTKKLNIKDLPVGSYTPIVPSTTSEQPQGYISTTGSDIKAIGGDISKRFGTAKTAIEKAQLGEQSSISAALQTAGQVAGGIGDIAYRGIKAVAPEFVEQGVKKTIGAIAETKPVQDIAKGYGEFKKARPETAANIEAIGNIASLIPIGKVGQLGVKAAPEAISKIGKASEGLPKALETAQQGMRQKIVSGVQKDVQDFIVSKKPLEKKVRELEAQKVPIREMLADEPIFRGLKVEKGTVNPDEAIGVIRDRIDESLKITQDFLPEVDKYAPKISKEAYRARAHASIAERGLLPADAKDITRAIDNQIDALPNEFLPSELDKIRAQARVSARDAKGQLKRDSEYAALESAARDLVFESVDNLPAVSEGEFAKLRTYIKHNIDLEKFLDTQIRGQKVKGGRLGQYGGRVVGAIAGSQGGVFGAIVGGEVGAKIASVLTNSSLGSSAKLRLISNLSDDPKVLQKAREMLAKQMQYEAPRLPAPKAGAFRSVTTGGAPIIPPAPTTFEAGAQKIMREPLKQPAERLQLNAPGQNPIQLRSPQSQPLTTTPITTISKNIIPPTIPQPAKKSKLPAKPTSLNTQSPLLSEARKYKTAEEFVNAQTQRYGGKVDESQASMRKHFKKIPFEEKYPEQKNKTITIYRGATRDFIPGDLATTDKNIASEYASKQGEKMYSKVVSSKDLSFVTDTGDLMYTPDGMTLTDIWEKAHKK